jgi:hypothetical protein
LGAIGGVGFSMLAEDRFEAAGGLAEHCGEHGQRGDPFGGGEVFDLAPVEALFVDRGLGGVQFVPEFVEGFATAGVDDVACEEKGGDLMVVDGIDRLFAEKPDGFELIGTVPGVSGLDEVFEFGPAGQEPLAAGFRGFEGGDDKSGVIERGVFAGPGDAWHSGAIGGMRVEGDGAAGIPEELAPEFGDLFIDLGLLGLACVAKLAGEAGKLGAVGPVDLPRDFGGAFGEVGFDRVARK